MKRLLLLLFSLCLSRVVNAGNIKILTQNPQQGSLIVARFLGEGDVYFDNRKLDKTKQGLIVFGVGRDAEREVFLTIKSGNESRKVAVSIAARDWKIEKVDGLPPSKVSPRSEKTLQRIAREASMVRSARGVKSDLTHFAMPFIKPAEGRISGVYGSQRILNGQPKRPHFGLDIANTEGTPVVSPANGTVSLVHPDMFYSGGTLIIDHGYGVSSTYIHLNSIDVKVGEVIAQGEKIGTIGATGRATGPHLDWRLNWFQTRLDPQLLIQQVN